MFKVIITVVFISFCINNVNCFKRSISKFDPNVYRFGDFMQDVRRFQKFESSNPNLVDLAKSMGLLLLVRAVKKAGMTDVLDHEGPFTWFGPTDKAFQSAPKFCYNNPLRDVMQYHLAQGNFSSRDFKNELLLPSLLSKRRIRINVYHNNSVVTANGRIVSKKDQRAFNGQIDVLQEMMCALYIGSAIVEINRCPTLQYFGQGVSLTSPKFQNLMNGSDPITVFAPTNDAIMKLPQTVLDQLRNNKTALEEVLKYHVVLNTWYSAGLSTGQTLATIHGAKLKVQGSTGNWKVNSANLILPDATVSNGVVHAIDTVLLPPGF